MNGTGKEEWIGKGRKEKEGRELESKNVRMNLKNDKITKRFETY